VRMKRVLGAMAALACVALLSGCSLLSDFPSPSNDDTDQKDDVVMQHIADAVKHHDVAALEKVFSPAARARAADLDSGLKYFLSFFPSGRMTWDVGGAGAGGGGLDEAPNFSWLASADYKVYSGAKTYDLYFANVTLDTPHPKYLGVYALGIVPYTTDPSAASGAPKPLYLWASQFGMPSYTPTGVPGVYHPGIAGSVIHTIGMTPAVEMQHIADALENHDAAELKSLFSSGARAKAANLDSGLKYFMSVLPSSGLTWRLEGTPGGGERGGYETGYVLTCPSYKASADGRNYELYFCEFTVDQPDTDYVGIYALGAAPYIAGPGAAPAPPKQFTAWAKSFKTDFDGKISASPGVYVPQN
jgi:hypothetical protein